MEGSIHAIALRMQLEEFFGAEFMGYVLGGRASYSQVVSRLHWAFGDMFGWEHSRWGTETVDDLITHPSFKRMLMPEYKTMYFGPKSQELIVAMLFRCGLKEHLPPEAMRFIAHKRPKRLSSGAMKVLEHLGVCGDATA